jgi:hypothetical protein
MGARARTGEQILVDQHGAAAAAVGGCARRGGDAAAGGDLSGGARGFGEGATAADLWMDG